MLVWRGDISKKCGDGMDCTVGGKAGLYPNFSISNYILYIYFIRIVSLIDICRYALKVLVLEYFYFFSLIP